MIRLGHLLWESRLLSTQNYWKTWCYVISMSWLLLLRFVAPCFSGSEYFYLFLLINAYFPSWYYKHYCQLPFTNKTVILILSMVKLNKLQYPTLVSMQSLIFNEHNWLEMVGDGGGLGNLIVVSEVLKETRLYCHVRMNFIWTQRQFQEENRRSKFASQKQITLLLMWHIWTHFLESISPDQIFYFLVNCN